MLSLLATLVLRSRDGEAVTPFVGSLRVIGPVALAPAMVAVLGFGIWMVVHDDATRAAPRSALRALPMPATTAKPRASCAAGRGAHD
jgi:hypothetical protein